jgi:toxin ParE1/3/4
MAITPWLQIHGITSNPDRRDFFSSLLDDPGAAQRFREAAIRRIGLLRHFPESAQPRTEFGPDIRTIPIGRYIVILRVALPKVIILRIVHAARDLPRLIKSLR